jgi:hypothetical protein
MKVLAFMLNDQTKLSWIGQLDASARISDVERTCYENLNSFDRQLKKWTLGDVAYERLKGLSKKDFGRDKAKWLEWIKAN